MSVSYRAGRVGQCYHGCLSLVKNTIKMQTTQVLLQLFKNYTPRVNI